MEDLFARFFWYPDSWNDFEKDYATMSSPFKWVMEIILSKRKKRSYQLMEVKYHAQKNPSAPKKSSTKLQDIHEHKILAQGISSYV